MCLQQDSTAQVSLITSLHAHVFPSGFLGHSNVPHSSKFMIMLLMGLGKRGKKDGTKMDQHNGGQRVGKAEEK